MQKWIGEDEFIQELKKKEQIEMTKVKKRKSKKRGNRK